MTTLTNCRPRTGTILFRHPIQSAFSGLLQSFLHIGYLDDLTLGETASTEAVDVQAIIRVAEHTGLALYFVKI